MKWHRISLQLIVLAASVLAAAQTGLSGNVEVTDVSEGKSKMDQSNVVVWLTPQSEVAPSQVRTTPQQHKFVLHQRHKTFVPHLLVVPLGALVDFPNHDPVFHNVFSLYEGKRFDLGLYEAGSSRAIRFDRPGVSYIFCNIHPEMGAVVIALRTPYYAVSDRSGRIVLPEVPPGRYMLNVWHEGASPETLKALQREVTISEDTQSLGTLRLKVPAMQMTAHKNKYGQDYPTPAPSGGLYEQR